MLSENVLVATIAGIVGIVTTYLTVRYKANQVSRSQAAKPKDRMETIFDGYEKLIQEQQKDIERKAILIESLQKIVDKQREEIEKSQEMIDTLRNELVSSQKRTGQLEDQLADMKKSYEQGKI